MKRVIAAIIGLVAVLVIIVRPIQAQTDIAAEVPAADHSFGQRISFHLRATAAASITQVNLFIEVEGQPGTIVEEVIFEPGSQVEIDHLFKPRAQDVPPFANITYWWEIHDGTGAPHRTNKQNLYYSDNRHMWQSLGDASGTSWEVYWVQGDTSFGHMVLDVAVAALGEITQDLGLEVRDTIRIFVYPSEEDLRSALNLAGYDWAGGQARPELGAILVGISDEPTAPGEVERLVPHELTHLLVYQAAGRELGRVPPWLNEGFASLNERRPDPDRQSLLEQGLAQGRLFSLEALCAPFPADENAARLAYAQSASVVRYLREEHGSQIIREMIEAYADGASCEAGVTQATGKSLSVLESGWRASLTGQEEVATASNDSAVWLALWLLTALLALPLVGVLRGRKDQQQVGGV